MPLSSNLNRVISLCINSGFVVRTFNLTNLGFEAFYLICTEPIPSLYFLFIYFIRKTQITTVFGWIGVARNHWLKKTTTTKTWYEIDQQINWAVFVPLEGIGAEIAKAKLFLFLLTFARIILFQFTSNFLYSISSIMKQHRTGNLWKTHPKNMDKRFQI